jgi:hypothetical protein
MGYRNKTYVAFASEDIRAYRLMEAWRENPNFDFDFFDAHDLYVSRDTSSAETIKRNLRQRMNNAKQFVLLASPDGKRKGGNGTSFLAYEVQTMASLDLPVVVANLNQSRNVDTAGIPKPLLDADCYTMSVSFQPKIIKYALDNYAVEYAKSSNTGAYRYKPHVYDRLGL